MWYRWAALIGPVPSQTSYTRLENFLPGAARPSNQDLRCAADLYLRAAGVLKGERDGDEGRPIALGPIIYVRIRCVRLNRHGLRVLTVQGAQWCHAADSPFHCEASGAVPVGFEMLTCDGRFDCGLRIPPCSILHLSHSSPVDAMVMQLRSDMASFKGEPALRS